MILFWCLIAAMLLLALCLVGFSFNRYASDEKPSHRKKTFWLLNLLLPIAALSLYFHWGASQQYRKWHQAQQQQKVVTKAIKQWGSVNNIIKRFKAYQKTHPDDAKAWYLLGKIYLSQGKLNKALTSLHRAHSLKPNDLSFSQAYLEASYFAHHKHLTKDTRQLLHRLLIATPRHPVLINLLAIDYYQHQQYRLAIKQWESLLPLFPHDSQDQRVLLKMIGKAQTKLQR